MMVNDGYPMVNVYITMEDPDAIMGKLTIWTGPLSSSQTLSHYHRVIHGIPRMKL